MASFAIHFNPALTDIPVVEVQPIKTSCKNTELNDLKIKTGGSKTSDFNIHVQNDKLGYIEKGEYIFSFSARVS
ncbi:hypothetical protein [Jejubacter sp. L23]|uniref:hypothetical protein n=1 Tax=Jejubacter sp. L23 TaxID=3092086 RepID=UPI003D7206E7